MEQLERIRAMEQRLNRLLAWQKTLSEALDGMEDAQKDADALAAYYDSREWRQDFEDCEAGKLPKGMLCGVLSEDGVYNALETQSELIRALWEED